MFFDIYCSVYINDEEEYKENLINLLVALSKLGSRNAIYNHDEFDYNMLGIRASHAVVGSNYVTEESIPRAH